MDAFVPPWATERGWDGVAGATGAGFPASPAPQPQRIREKPKPSMAANPWEGVLGPSAVESAFTVKTHIRADVSTLIKTRPEVWKAGKQPTQVSNAPLPGTKCEAAAAKRTPSHLRGNEKASRGVVAAHERLPDATTIKATKVSVAGGMMTVRPKRTVIPASSMSAASLAALSELCDSSELPERAQSAAAVLEDSQFSRSTRRPESEAELQAFVRDLKAQFSKLQQTAAGKEAELERLRAAAERTCKDEEHAWEADKDFEDFKQRIEARNASIEDSLPNLSKQKHELDDVIKRLQKANKIMNNRLAQCREELRVYHGEIRDMTLLMKDVETARNDAQSQAEKMKVSVKEDTKKRNQDLARRQARVEKMLSETKLQAERLKEVQKREEEEHKARQAEEDLARQRAYENGTDFGTEMRRIRENVHGPAAVDDAPPPQEEEDRVASAVKKIFQAAHASDAEEVLAFFDKQRERKASLEVLANDLTARVDRLKVQAEDPAANPPAGAAGAQGSGGAGEEHADAGERLELEEAVRDIESFADQNRVVNEVMRQLLRKYISWAGSVYKTMVRASEDESFLRVSRKLAKRMPFADDDEDRLAIWCSDSLVAMQNALAAKMLEVERAQPAQEADAAPRGPGTGPRITAISSNQTLLVSSRGGGAKQGTQMERL